MTSHELDALLQGAVDMHVHSSPDVIPRKMSDLALAAAAKQAGLAGVLLKCHHSPTAARAALVQEHMPGFRVFGGIVLNRMAGGLNAAAVEAELALGAKEVWLPTISAANHLRFTGGDVRQAVAVTQEDGRLRPELYDIFDLVAIYDAILATGHLAPVETVLVVQAARARRVAKILVTHPEWEVVDMPVPLQRELARQGVFFERCYYATHSSQHLHPQVVAQQIREVGVATTVLSSDFGQAVNPPPPAGFRQFVADMLAYGIEAREIAVMIKDNPRALLGLS